MMIDLRNWSEPRPPQSHQVAKILARVELASLLHCQQQHEENPGIDGRWEWDGLVRWGSIQPREHQAAVGFVPTRTPPTTHKGLATHDNRSPDDDDVDAHHW